MDSVDHKFLLYELKLELPEYDKLELGAYDLELELEAQAQLEFLLYISNESLSIEKNLISKFCYERIG